MYYQYCICENVGVEVEVGVNDSFYWLTTSSKMLPTTVGSVDTVFVSWAKCN